MVPRVHRHSQVGYKIGDPTSVMMGPQRDACIPERPASLLSVQDASRGPRLKFDVDFSLDGLEWVGTNVKETDNDENPQK